jgi:hypothetical protein
MTKQKPTPPWSILDRSHPWTPAADTNVAATFRRVRAQQQAPKTLPWRKP